MYLRIKRYREEGVEIRIDDGSVVIGNQSALMLPMQEEDQVMGLPIKQAQSTSSVNYSNAIDALVRTTASAAALSTGTGMGTRRVKRTF